MAAAGGVRSVVLGDRAERGVRALEFRTGSGLNFDVLVDRAMDIGSAEYRGVSFGWQSATGFRTLATSCRSRRLTPGGRIGGGVC